jgi:hypothetical protein
MAPHSSAQQAARTARQQLLDAPWAHWRDAVLAELAQAHPDLPAKLAHMDVTRYGHAMACPVPGFASQIGLQPSQKNHAVLQKTQRMLFAHSDWSGYSIFEEAFVQGHRAGSLASKNA